MIPTIQFGKLYKYEEIHNKIYIARFNNKKIIRIRDIRFYKKGVSGRDVEKEAFFKAVFNKETKELTFGIVRFKTTFGSGKSPALQIPIIS